MAASAFMETPLPRRGMVSPAELVGLDEHRPQALAPPGAARGEEDLPREEVEGMGEVPHQDLEGPSLSAGVDQVQEVNQVDRRTARAKGHVVPMGGGRRGGRSSYTRAKRE